MKISAINSYNQQKSLTKCQPRNLKSNALNKTQAVDSVSFEGKASKIIGSVAGGAVGGAMGTATLTGGSMAVLTGLASGPVGWTFLALYAGSGILLGGAFGKMIAEIVDRDDD